MWIIKFICLHADDNKFYAKIADLNDYHCLQLDLDNRSDRWQISFNTSECKTMYFGRSNLHFVYKLDNEAIQQANEENILALYLIANSEIS